MRDVHSARRRRRRPALAGASQLPRSRSRPVLPRAGRLHQGGERRLRRLRGEDRVPRIRACATARSSGSGAACPSGNAGASAGSGPRRAGASACPRPSVGRSSRRSPGSGAGRGHREPLSDTRLDALHSRNSSERAVELAPGTSPTSSTSRRRCPVHVRARALHARLLHPGALEVDEVHRHLRPVATLEPEAERADAGHARRRARVLRARFRCAPLDPADVEEAVERDERRARRHRRRSEPRVRLRRAEIRRALDERLAAARDGRSRPPRIGIVVEEARHAVHARPTRSRSARARRRRPAAPGCRRARRTARRRSHRGGDARLRARRDRAAAAAAAASLRTEVRVACVLPAMVNTLRLWSRSRCTSRSAPPAASAIASIADVSRPSETFATHSSTGRKVTRVSERHEMVA